MTSSSAALFSMLTAHSALSKCALVSSTSNVSFSVNKRLQIKTCTGENRPRGTTYSPPNANTALRTSHQIFSSIQMEILAETVQF